MNLGVIALYFRRQRIVFSIFRAQPIIAMSCESIFGLVLTKMLRF